MKTIKNLTADELRKSILQLAIQGKLVKQDPNDEPASELVKRIYEEKNKLIAEGKIKKDKNQSYIFKSDDNCYYEKIGNNEPIKLEDLPFDIPDNWMWVRLKNTSILNGGFAFKSEKFSDNGIRVIRISDFNENGILNKDIKRYPYSTELEQYKILINDILLCMTGGTVGKSAYINSIKEDSYINQRVALIRVHTILSKYFYSYLMSPNTIDIINKNKTSTNDNISMKLIEDFLIPLPPLEEQQRIVDKINSFEPLLEKYDKVEKELSRIEIEFPEKLKKSILQYAIEGKLVKQDPNDEPASVLLERIKQEKERLIKEGKIKRDKNESYIYQCDDKNYYEQLPKSWAISTLSSICSKIVDGNHNPPKGIEQKSIFLMLSSQNIGSKGLINMEKVRYLNESQFLIENKRTNLQYNDILFTSVGTIGRSFVYKEQNLNLSFQRSVSIITTFIYPEYLKYYFDAPSSQNKFIKESNGTAQKGFYLNQLSSLFVVIPPYKQQIKISEKINYLFGQID